jgi:plastocyanin
MNRNLILLVGIIALVSVLITGYLFFNFGNKKSSVQNPVTQNIQKNKGIKSNEPVIPAKTVTLTSSGFVPVTLTIKVGTRVIWINNSGTAGTINSDNYPTNLLYPFLNLGQFENDASFSTIFTKPGTYTYYNFLSQNQNQKGTIVVQ